MNTISAPLNMPPRYADFAKGRVLVGFNTSGQNVDTPWLRDDKDDVAISTDYWDNPSASDELGKELKDTFHEVRATSRPFLDNTNDMKERFFSDGNSHMFSREYLCIITPSQWESICARGGILARPRGKSPNVVPYSGAIKWSVCGWKPYSLASLIVGTRCTTAPMLACIYIFLNIYTSGTATAHAPGAVLCLW